MHTSILRRNALFTLCVRAEAPAARAAPTNGAEARTQSESYPAVSSLSTLWGLGVAEMGHLEHGSEKERRFFRFSRVSEILRHVAIYHGGAVHRFWAI